MKESLITFETAKLAKEKGFEIRTYFKFDRNNEIDRTPSLKYQIMNGINILIKPSPFTFAPTQSLLQKWLREVHNIHLSLYPTIDNDLYIYTINVHNSFKESFKNYEDALEIGLKEGLKLIPEIT